MRDSHIERRQNGDGPSLGLDVEEEHVVISRSFQGLMLIFAATEAPRLDLRFFEGGPDLLVVCAVLRVLVSRRLIGNSLCQTDGLDELLADLSRQIGLQLVDGFERCANPDIGTGLGGVKLVADAL